jgi:hypothetical protein
MFFDQRSNSATSMPPLHTEAAVLLSSSGGTDPFLQT